MRSGRPPALRRRAPTPPRARPGAACDRAPRARTARRGSLMSGRWQRRRRTAHPEAAGNSGASTLILRRAYCSVQKGVQLDQNHFALQAISDERSCRRRRMDPAPSRRDRAAGENARLDQCWRERREVRFRERLCRDRPDAALVADAGFIRRVSDAVARCAPASLSKLFSAGNAATSNVLRLPLARTDFMLPLVFPELDQSWTVRRAPVVPGAQRWRP